jgi:hypothetical protein
MRALLKSFCLIVMLGVVRGSLMETSDVEVEKRETSNTTLKAPIIAVPSEHWCVLSLPFNSLKFKFSS